MSESDKIINIHEVSYKTIETWTTLLMFPANCSKWYFHQLESKNKEMPKKDLYDPTGKTTCSGITQEEPATCFSELALSFPSQPRHAGSVGCTWVGPQ